MKKSVTSSTSIRWSLGSYEYGQVGLDEHTEMIYGEHIYKCFYVSLCLFVCASIRFYVYCSGVQIAQKKE